MLMTISSNQRKGQLPAEAVAAEDGLQAMAKENDFLHSERKIFSISRSRAASSVCFFVTSGC